MAIAAVGLRTSIWNNNIRSILLLLFYPLIIGAMIWAIAFLLSGWLPQSTAYGTSNAEIMANYANATIYAYWPLILAVIVIWFIVSYFFNTKMIRALSHAHPVTRQQEPDLYNLLENLCIASGMKMPKLNIIETHARNAFASGVDDNSYTVTVTRGLMNSLQKDELEGVLAHELTHIINRDVRLMMVCIIFTGMIGFAAQMAWSSIRYNLIFRRRGGSGKQRSDPRILLVFATVAIILWIGYLATLFTRFALSRRREFMADAGAVEITKNPEAMMRALMRISGRANIPQTPADIDMMCIENAQPFFGMFATHPPIEKRIAMLSEMTGTPVPQIDHAPAAHEERLPSGAHDPWLTAQRGNRAKS
jgi:heat shock protein HtpX